MASHNPETEIKGYELLYTTARQEVTTRLSRDSSLQVQLIASIGAVAAASALPGATNLIVIAPALALYFAVVMGHNRWMITTLAAYLRERIEAPMSKLTGIPTGDYWENFLKVSSPRWERTPSVEPMVSWSVFVAVYVYLGTVPSLTFEVWLLSLVVYSCINVAASVYILGGFTRDQRARLVRLSHSVQK